MAKTESDLQKKLWSWNRWSGGIFFTHADWLFGIIFFLIYEQNGLIQLTNKAYVKYQNFPLPFVWEIGPYLYSSWLFGLFFKFMHRIISFNCLTRHLWNRLWISYNLLDWIIAGWMTSIGKYFMNFKDRNDFWLPPSIW